MRGYDRAVSSLKFNFDSLSFKVLYVPFYPKVIVIIFIILNYFSSNGVIYRIIIEVTKI